MAESSISLSPKKKKVKRSKLAGTANMKTSFKSEWKKNFLSSQAYQMMLQPVRDIIETAQIKLFFVISSNMQISAKYEVWKDIIKGKILLFVLYYFTDFL